MIEQTTELQAVLLASGRLQLEWTDVQSSTGREEKHVAASFALQQHIQRQYQNDPNGWLLSLGLGDQQTPLPSSLNFWRRLAAFFARRLGLTPDLEELRQAAVITFDDEELLRLLAESPPMTGSEHLNLDLLRETWQALNRAFATRIAVHNGSVASFIQAHRTDLHLAGRVYFHLVENRRGESPFAFLATYSVRAATAGSPHRHLPLKHALQEYAGNEAKLLDLLITVHRTAKASALIREILANGELFHPLTWSASEAYTFLREIPLYEEAGIICRIPDWWNRRQASLRLNIRIGEREPTHLGFASLLDFRPRLLLGDEEISQEEASRLLAEGEGLALLKGRWVEVDHERLRRTLAACEELERQAAAAGGIDFRTALRLQLQEGAGLAGKETPNEIDAVENGRWLQDLHDKLQQPTTLLPVNTDRRFRAELRPYQAVGLNWLHHHYQMGFGACLADDMGLGKTVQVLALLNALSSHPGPSLLVVPASLLSNWGREIENFSPELRFLIAHPGLHRTGKVPIPSPQELQNLDLVITSYTLIQKYDWLREKEWRLLILDEAQAIKNPTTAQTRTIKKLRAARRLALTGTPIENRLSDLWSLFDFLNPGLLGSPKEFTALSKQMSIDPGGYGRLRRMIAPFILRRMKNDPAIIGDLPDKVEIKSWAELSKKQVVFYQGAIESLRQQLETADGIRRRGLILAALTKFKQLCNHPDQYLGNNGDFAEPESGKFSRLREICETIYEKREKALIFTQFRELTAPLHRFLGEIFGRPGLILHGGTAVGKRKDLIDEFQGEQDYIPFMVLSLKAGGVGLNLTAANHVIHFDRWWNPAVENQATDRAFRIGQQRKVMVHKLITKGTVEEKIDAMLEQKSDLAAAIIPTSGEKWLTEMNNEELFDLFRLS